MALTHMGGLFLPPPLPPLSALCPPLLIQTSCLLSPYVRLLIPLPHPLLSSTRSPHHPHVRSLLPRYVLHSHQPDFLTRSFRSGTCFLFAAPTAELFKSCQSLEASALTSSSALFCPLNEGSELIQTDVDSVVLPVHRSLRSFSHPRLRVTPSPASCYASDLPSGSNTINT